MLEVSFKLVLSVQVDESIHSYYTRSCLTIE